MTLCDSRKIEVQFFLIKTAPQFFSNHKVSYCRAVVFPMPSKFFKPPYLTFFQCVRSRSAQRFKMLLYTSLMKNFDPGRQYDVV